MNFKDQIRRIIREKGVDEIRRHASVSTRNNHYCNQCFCCACVDAIRKIDKSQAIKDAIAGNYINGLLKSN